MEDLRVNEEAVEVVEECVNAGNKYFVNGLIIGATVGVGVVTYKYAVKPLVKKFKDKRAEKKAGTKPELNVVETEYTEDGIQE